MQIIKEKGPLGQTRRPSRNRFTNARASYSMHHRSRKISTALPTISQYCQAIDLRLKPYNEWKRANCPLCHGKNTFFMRPDCGAFKCRRCNAAGRGLIQLHMQLRNLSFDKARAELLQMMEVTR